MESQDKDIVEHAASAGNFSTLGNALKAAGLVAKYKGIGPFTFFAPTDAAFSKLPAGTVNSLLRDKAKLAALLNFHAIAGAVLVQDMKARDARSQHGASVTIAANESGFTVNGVQLSPREIEASNGVIHPIDTLMSLPQEEPQ
jgi:uncharacterized surface protein with fasciclin (FAS1) repeats